MRHQAPVIVVADCSNSSLVASAVVAAAAVGVAVLVAVMQCGFAPAVVAAWNCDVARVECWCRRFVVLLANCRWAIVQYDSVTEKHGGAVVAAVVVASDYALAIVAHLGRLVVASVLHQWLQPLTVLL